MARLELLQGAVMAELHGWRQPLHYGNSEIELKMLREIVGVHDLSPRGAVRLVGDGAVSLAAGLSSGQEELAVGRVREPFNVNSLALAGAEAALGDDEHVRRSVEVNAEGREYFVRELAALGLPFVPTQGNFLMVEVGDGAKIYESLLREGVIVRPVGGYGFPAHVRISIGTPEENRRTAEALAAVLEK